MSQQINLFNPALLKQKQRLSAAGMAQGLGLVLLGMIAFGGYTHLQGKALTSEALAASTQLEAAKAQLAKAIAEHAPRQKSTQLEAELAQLEADIVQQRKAFDIVERGGVGDTKGYSEYLRAFSRQSVEGLWLTGFSIDSVGRHMELQGRAQQPDLVPSYIQRLSREPIMQGKSFGALAMATPEVEMPGNGQTGETGGAVRRTPAKYVEFVLKSAGESPDKAIRHDKGLPDMLQRLPSAPAAPMPGGLPGLKDRAEAH